MRLPARCLLTAALCSSASLAEARDPLKETDRDEGWSGEFSVDYDGSRSRTNTFHAGLEVQWSTPRAWVSLSGDTYSDLSTPLDLRHDSYATLQLGYALYKNNEERLYWNAKLDLDPHSLLASRGWDITPSLDVAYGLTEDWWIGYDVGVVLATRPDEGDHAGFLSQTFWIYWLCGFTPDGTDNLSLSLWAAGNEVPGGDHNLFAELEYTFDVTEKLEASIGVGTDIMSQWDHLGVYFSAGLKWSF